MLRENLKFYPEIESTIEKLNWEELGQRRVVEWREEMFAGHPNIVLTVPIMAGNKIAKKTNGREYSPSHRRMSVNLILKTSLALK